MNNGMSLIKIVSSNGLSTLSCRIPDVTLGQFEQTSSHITLFLMCDKRYQ